MQQMPPTTQEIRTVFVGGQPCAPAPVVLPGAAELLASMAAKV